MFFFMMGKGWAREALMSVNSKTVTVLHVGAGGRGYEFLGRAGAGGAGQDGSNLKVVFQLLLLRYHLPGKPSQKNLLMFEFFPNGHDPPLYFWNASRNFLKILFYNKKKVPHSVWILVIFLHFPWKMSKCLSQSRKIPHHLWN